MNKNCFRVIFNQQRGQTMVVGELAQSPGPDSSVSSVPAPARWLRCAQPLVFTLTIGWNLLAHATIVTDAAAPAAQRPTVVTAPNGVSVVNIQTPNHASVSHNTYSRFDVERQGAVLNNSAAATQTQLAEVIAGNAHLANGAALLILNEVHSSNPSLLRGMIEVAGQGARHQIKLQVQQFNNHETLHANGNLSLTVRGELNYYGTLRSLQQLTIQANFIQNHANGVINATHTSVLASEGNEGKINNRGLIDGQTTEVRAHSLNNISTGSLYGYQVIIIKRVPVVPQR